MIAVVGFTAVLQSVFADESSCAAAGPQSPRDIDGAAGDNGVRFAKAPPSTEMRLCNIHFHRNAEHKSAGYPDLAGEGSHAGYVCRGVKPGAEVNEASGCAGISAGDTVEVHWVFTTCDVKPGPTLASCTSSVCQNPQLRVEAKIFYLTEGEGADFATYDADGGSQPVALPGSHGAVEYLGSTTGTSFDNQTCSPLQVTWRVRPTCGPLDKASLDAWCADNVFDEDHAHGVRPLVTAPEHLAWIE
ncbi:MAG: delta-class carbonic anhydrase [Thermoanaerobaculia bacterium]